MADDPFARLGLRKNNTTQLTARQEVEPDAPAQAVAELVKAARKRRQQPSTPAQRAEQLRRDQQLRRAAQKAQKAAQRRSELQALGLAPPIVLSDKRAMVRAGISRNVKPNSRITLPKGAQQ